MCQQDAVNYITHFVYKANNIVIKGAMTKHFHHSRNIEIKYGSILYTPSDFKNSLFGNLHRCKAVMNVMYVW